MMFPGLSDAELSFLAEQMPNWQLRQIRYGNGQHPIIIIDNFSSHADDLITDSKAQTFEKYGPHYPGVQAHAPVDYLAPTQTALEFLLSTAFGYGDIKAKPEMCMYSYVTTSPDALTPLQRYPHYDGGHPRKVALLHYLCDETQGGTQFYRHDRTGFETVFPDRNDDYAKARQDDVKQLGLRAPSYFNDSEHGFTRLERVAARFNRALLYPSSTLHSGDLGPSPKFSTTPVTGRLTVNTFFIPR